MQLRGEALPDHLRRGRGGGRGRAGGRAAGRGGKPLALMPPVGNDMSAMLTSLSEAQKAALLAALVQPCAGPLGTEPLRD